MHFLLPLLLVLLGAIDALAATDRTEAFETWSEAADCRDDEPHCTHWAEVGECSTNPAFMLKSCRLACKQCEPAPVDPGRYRGQLLVLNTTLGEIRIRPLFSQAPQTAALVMELAHHPGGCEGCNFYRNEAHPEPGSSGPPYGLLQGSMAGLLKVPEREGGDIVMRAGHVAMIPSTREFFINVVDHEGWGGSMTVWGDIADEASMRVVESALRLPYKAVKHPTYGTVMRMLDETIAFTPMAETATGSS